jgi:cellulose synthase operon protein C
MRARELFTRHAGRLLPALIAAMLLSLALPFVPRVLRACGPYFALDILSGRKDAALRPPPAISVTDGLAPEPGEKLPVNESNNETARTEAESSNLSPEQQERVTAMRARSDGDASYAAGEGLPPMIREYTAGAVSYHHRQYDKAREYFTRVLAIEPTDPVRPPHVVWARYMLGAIARLQGDVEGASAHWAATRGLVRSGLTDPLGLAVASLGEEGRLWLKPGTIAKAVELYAKQAAYGSEGGRASLLMVAEQILGDQALLDEGLRDATTRRLILRYLYAGSVTIHEVSGVADHSETTAKRVLDAFERQRVERAEGADLLAAEAYANGRFEEAARFATYESTPLSAWITGKLALRRGDRSVALRSFSQAVKGLPAHRFDRRRALAETGVLHLSGGDFAQAMEVFHAAVVDSSGGEFMGADYWTDVAYLAERVLTLDELLPLVDRLAPPATRADLDAIEKRIAELPEDYWREETPAEQLRELAGRRLMRAGRYDDALRYFDFDEKLHGVAKKYVDAMTTAQAGGWWQNKGARAEALFAAAKIARSDGMEILGFELAPDFAVHEGSFAYFPPPPPDLAARGDATPDERKRVDASKPAIESRFHYRLTAVDHALASAEALPHRSQAFAAILCRATSWIIDREPERAAKVYARYLKEGPYVSWAGTFGRECPEPDFAGAERRRQQERLATVTWIYTHHPRRTIAGAAVLAVAGIAGLVWLVRRRRTCGRPSQQ